MLVYLDGAHGHARGRRGHEGAMRGGREEAKECGPDGDEEDAAGAEAPRALALVEAVFGGEGQKPTEEE